MLDVLRQKMFRGGLDNLTPVEFDLDHDPLLPDRYNLVVTSMTLHHIADTERALKTFYDLLLPGGTLCIADLDPDGGLFHTPDAAESVRHHGFGRAELRRQLMQAGFNNVRDITAHTLRKPGFDGIERDFPVFLMTGTRGPNT
jgi:ubiquinone/menaquinone biosynthesis C-methylase UbiE